MKSRILINGILKNRILKMDLIEKTREFAASFLEGGAQLS